MKAEETKKAADKLIEVFRPFADAGALSTEEETINAIHCAIASTENTIKVLSDVEIGANVPNNIDELGEKHELLLNELKTRL